VYRLGEFIGAVRTSFNRLSDSCTESDCHSVNTRLGWSTWQEVLRGVGVAQLLDQISAPAIGHVAAIGHGYGLVTLQFVSTMRYAKAYLAETTMVLTMMRILKMVMLDDHYISDGSCEV
jgi:hypothetical protein